MSTNSGLIVPGEAPSRRRALTLGATALGVVALGVGVSGTASAADRYNLGPSTLRRGSRGGYVRTLQTALNETNGAGIAVDGSFGKGTEGAVRNFQSSRRIAVDGRVGRGTKAALNSSPASGGGGASAPAAPQSGNFYMPGGHHVTQANGAGQILKSTGGGNGLVNGTRLRYVLLAAERQGLGALPRTSSMSLSKSAVRNTVKAFQRKNGIGADAVIGGGTWNKAMQVLGLGYGFDCDGYIAQTRDYAVAGDAGTRINAMVDYFRYFENRTPYTWGGAGNGGDVAAGFDCSGLVFQMLSAGGIVVGSTNPIDHARRDFRSTQAIYNDGMLRTFDLGQRQDGDVITFSSSSSRSVSKIAHDGIFYQGHLLEAFGGGGVRATPWNGGDIRRDGYTRYVMPRVKRAFV